MSLWLQRSQGDHSYWDMAAANFKHAIGLCCELVVEHVNSFIHSGGRRKWMVYTGIEEINGLGITTVVNMCKISLIFFFFWLSDIGYESLINLMLKDLFKLLVSCVSEPAETISRVGCSCIRSDAKVMNFLEGRLNEYSLTERKPDKVCHLFLSNALKMDF